MSLDGMIAKKDNSTDWFNTTSQYEQGLVLTEQATSELLRTIDCYIMGANTYEHAFALSRNYGWAYGETPVIVLTHRKLPVEKDTVSLYAGDLAQFVKEKLEPKYKNVWIAGGASLAMDFLRAQLVDEIRISILPIILGDGIPFFDQLGKEQNLQLLDTRAYRNGMVELQYGINKN